MPMGGHIPSKKLSIFSSYMGNMLQNIFKHSVNLWYIICTEVSVSTGVAASVKTAKIRANAPAQFV